MYVIDVDEPSPSDRMSDHNCSRFSGLAAVEGRRRLSGWRFEPGLAAVAAKSLSSVGFTHPQGSYCEQSRPIAGLNQQCKTPGDGERRGALMTQGHLRRRGDSSRKAQERTSSRSSSSVQAARLFSSESASGWKCCSARLMRWSEWIGEMRIG